MAFAVLMAWDCGMVRNLLSSGILNRDSRRAPQLCGQESVRINAVIGDRLLTEWGFLGEDFSHIGHCAGGLSLDFARSKTQGRARGCESKYGWAKATSDGQHQKLKFWDWCLGGGAAKG
jgi:hypothetical protein